MANLTTVARPYAKAILQLAQQNDAYSQWSEALNFLANLANDPVGRRLLINRTVAVQDKANFICSLNPELLFKDAQNFVKVLAENRRLLILPALYALYEQMRKKEQGIVIVQLILSQPASISLEDLATKFVLQQDVDPKLIGGGIAKVDNRVIDASILGRLTAMREQLRY